MRIFILTTDNQVNENWNTDRFAITQIYARSIQAALTNQAYLNLCESGNCGIVEYIGEENTTMPLEWELQTN